MRLKNLFLASLTAFAMVSCSESVIETGDGTPDLKRESTSFVKISLVNPTAVGSRAGEELDYEAGSADENRVEKILLVFFDAGRNYVSRSEVTLTGDEGVSSPGNGNGNTVERVLTTVAQVDLPANINFPRYVIAYVNPTSASSDLITNKLEDVIKYIRSRETVSSTGARTMNNSVYFQDGTGYVRFATEVDFQNQFYTSEAEAKKATANAIDIYVERVEAKVRLGNQDITKINVGDVKGESGVETSASGDAVGYALTFEPEAWFVNGTEKRTFLLKNYREHRDNYKNGHADFGDTYDYGVNLKTLKTEFGRTLTPSVNDEANYRSYWAIDPTYFLPEDADPYPAISYDVKYGETVNRVTGKDYPLAYQSYASISKQWNEAKSTSYVKFDDGKKTCEYVLENTMDAATLLSSNAKASMTSVVLLGHYVIKDNDGNIVFDGTETDKTKEFYVRHEGNGSKLVMLSDEEAINYFLERSGSLLFVKEYGTEEGSDELVATGNYVPLRAAHLKNPVYGVSYDDFLLIHPSKEQNNGKLLSEQWRTLRFALKNGVPSENIYMYDYEANNGAGGYRNIKEIDLTGDKEKGVESMYDKMYSAFGVLERFESGKAYFNVPLKHIWAPAGSSNEFKADEVKLGYYGVVRNHIYHLTINSINGLGTGIGDIEQPIVPPTETDQYYISTRLNILKWRVVGQSVDL